MGASASSDEVAAADSVEDSDNSIDTATSPTTSHTMRVWTLNKNGTASRIVRLIVLLTFKFWVICSTSVLVLLLGFWFFNSIACLILLHFAVIGILYHAQDLLLYYPDQPPSARIFVELPSSFGLAYETVYIRSHDGTQLHAQLVHQQQQPHLVSSAPTFVLFHGNAGNIGHRLPNAQSLCFCSNVNILLVEYRGYGRSQGLPSEDGLYMDARAALDYLFSRTDICQQKIIVFGRSLGGAVALRVSSEPQYAGRLAAVIVENTFTSIADMARSMFYFRVLNYLPDWCYKNKYASRCLVNRITIPSLFISGLQDSLVPPHMMHQLYELSGSRMKRLALFADGTHNETWQCTNYYATLNRFLAELEQSRKGLFVAPNSVYAADMQQQPTHSNAPYV